MIENKNREEADPFARQVKELIENHSLPVDEGLWAGIEQQLNQRKKRVLSPLWYWISGGAVAAAVVMVLLIAPYNSEKSKLNIARVKTNVAAPIVSANSNTTQGNPISATMAENEMPAKVKKMVGTTLSVKNDILSEVKHRAPDGNNARKELSEVSVVDVIAHVTEHSETKTAEKKQDDINAVDRAIEQAKDNNAINTLPDLNDYPEYEPNMNKTKRANTTLFAAFVGSGNGLNHHYNANNGMMYETNSASGKYLLSSDVVKKSEMNMLQTESTNKEFIPPLSVGITLMKALNNRIGFETGLSYTYLRTNYSSPVGDNYRASLQLHYLGIPLSLRVKVWEHNNWNLYLSGGTMLEKGLQSVFAEQFDNTVMLREREVKQGIDGWQWSVNGALGVDYRFARNLRIFAEPKLSYYFDNNQPESARSEHPLNVGVNGGLRIEF